MTNQPIKIDAQVIRSAHQCQAKDDVRYFMVGILLAGNGDVVATNGHILFKCPGAFEVPDGFKDTIVYLSKPIPVRTEFIYFDLDSRHATLNFTNGKTDELLFSIVDGEFPDYSRIIPKEDYTEASPTIGVNSDYLSRVAKVFPYDAISINHGHETSGPLIIRSRSAPGAMADSVMLLMPCTL